MTYDHSLQSLAQNHDRERESFANEFPDVADCIDSVIFVTKAYTSALIQSSSDLLSTNLILLIPRFQSYFEQSILLATEGRIDESYALLRMSTEVMRDIHKLMRAEDESSDRIYSNRIQDEDKYRKRFKFRTNHGPSVLAFRIYKMASSFGIHGHMMTAVGSMQKTSKVGTPFGDFNLLKMTNLGKMNAVCIWLRAVFPLYAMLIDARKDRVSQPNTVVLEVESMLYEMITSLTPMCEELERNLKTEYDVEIESCP